MSKITGLVVVLLTLALAPSSTAAYEIFRATVMDEHLPNHLPLAASYVHNYVSSENGVQVPLVDTLIMDDLDLSDQDAGNSFTVTRESDPQFELYVQQATNGTDDPLAQRIMFGPDVFKNNFQGFSSNTSESSFLNSGDYVHPLISGPDLTGFDIESINVTMTYLRITKRFDLPPGSRFQPMEAEFVISYNGRYRADFNNSKSLDAGDIDLLSDHIHSGGANRHFDLNDDGMINDDDRRTWVEGIRGTYFGDANLDGEFNSGDLVSVFQAGEYEDDAVMNSSWVTGDWNGDVEFGTDDLVLAFQDAGFEQGPREAVSTVPEPTGVGPLTIAIVTFTSARRSRRYSKTCG